MGFVQENIDYNFFNASTFLANIDGKNFQKVQNSFFWDI